MVDGDRRKTCAEHRLFLRIEPVDTLFFRDARPFGAASRSTSGLPKPQTVVGALRTAMLALAGIDLEEVAERIRSGQTFGDAAAAASGSGAAIGAVRFRGPWFCRGKDILFPAPATLRRERHSGTIVRLDPLDADLPGWKPPEKGMKPLWRKGRERLETVSGYLTPNSTIRFLGGGAPDEIVPDTDLFAFDDRTGIGVDADRAVAADRMIYAVRMLVLRPGVHLQTEIVGPEEALNLFPPAGYLLALGGEGRRAAVSPDPHHPGLPCSAATGPTDRRLLVLTAPAPLNGWRPRGLGILAAAVPGHDAVSGWDLARGGPKPNRFVVPAGSVYFLRPDATVPTTDSLAEPDDAAVGWGSYLEGTWNHA